MQSEFQGAHNQSFLFYSAFRLKTWMLGAMYFIFNFQYMQLCFRYFNNI